MRLRPFIPWDTYPVKKREAEARGIPTVIVLFGLISTVFTLKINPRPLSIGVSWLPYQRKTFLNHQEMTSFLLFFFLSVYWLKTLLFVSEWYCRAFIGERIPFIGLIQLSLIHWSRKYVFNTILVISFSRLLTRLSNRKHPYWCKNIIHTGIKRFTSVLMKVVDMWLHFGD